MTKFIEGEHAIQMEFNKTLNSIFKNGEFANAPTTKNIRTINDDIAKYFEGNSKSKNGTGNALPDFFYYNENHNLIVINEVKPKISKHEQAKKELAHYLKPFIESNYNVIGFAMSGKLEDELSSRISTYIVMDGKIVDKEISYLYDYEHEYMNLFKTQETEDAIIKINRTLSVVNNDLRDVLSSNRPTLVAGILISMYSVKDLEGNVICEGSLKKLLDSGTQLTISLCKNNLLVDLSEVLESAKIDSQKSSVIHKEFEKSLSEPSLYEEDVIVELVKSVYSIMNILVEEYEYDIMAQFYQTFLRYVTGDGKDLGIILTPQHITELMVELLNIYDPISDNDIIYDPCTGTGTFLTSFMNFQISRYAQDDLVKQERIKNENLIGLELKEFMYTLAMANMLVRGDGKSQIALGDFFKASPPKNNKDRKPKYGIINPPYSQSKKDKGNNKSEIEFIEKLLDEVSGVVAAIVPKSSLFKTDKSYKNPRENIYKKHTLLAVIGMPTNLFEPAASTHTAIAVFKANKPHTLNDKVFFYNLTYDGFDLYNNSRQDLRGAWENHIREEVLSDIESKRIIKGKSIYVDKIKKSDEWIPEAHIPNDFSYFIENQDKILESKLKEFALFKFKQKTGILDLEIEKNNEKDKQKKEEIENKIPRDLELFELIQSEGLSVLEIIDDE